MDTEITQASDTWRQTHISTILTKQISNTWEDLDVTVVNDPLTTTKPVGILPFSYWAIKGMTKFKGHIESVYVIAKALENLFSDNVVPTSTYTYTRLL